MFRMNLATSYKQNELGNKHSECISQLFYFDQLEVDYSSGYEIENESEIEKGDGNWIFNIKLIFVALDWFWFSFK